LKFTYGKKQTVDSVELDSLFTELKAALEKHPLVPAANIDVLVSEWINDILFVAGKITEDELKEAMQTFETAETAAQEPAGGDKSAETEDDDDSEDEDDEE
jgi:osmotically-inducible protein OsmY